MSAGAPATVRAMPESPPPDDSLPQRLWRSWRPFLLAMAAVVVTALVAGLLFSRADPRRAAGLLIEGRVETESEGEVTGPPAPTSGDPSADPVCGVSEAAVDVDTQVGALAAGIVVVQYRDVEDAEAVVGALAETPTQVLVAPNAELDARVVATAWGRRLELEQVDGKALRAFVTAHQGLGPDVTECGG